MKNKGFTLVEIIFALAIEIMVLGVILSAYLVNRNSFEKEILDLDNILIVNKIINSGLENGRKANVLERQILGSLDYYDLWFTYDATPLNDYDSELTSKYCIDSVQHKYIYEFNIMDDYYLEEGEEDPTPSQVIINKGIYQGQFEPITYGGTTGVVYSFYLETTSLQTGQKARLPEPEPRWNIYGRNNRVYRNYVFK